MAKKSPGGLTLFWKDSIEGFGEGPNTNSAGQSDYKLTTQTIDGGYGRDSLSSRLTELRKLNCNRFVFVHRT